MLTQQELLEQLSAMGENVTSQTLRNREKQGLISPSYSGGSGRAGRSVFYPNKCLWENYAAGRLMNSPRLRLKASEVKMARDLAIRMELDPSAWENFSLKAEHEKLEVRFAEHWHAYYLHGKNGAPKNWAAIVYFVEPNSCGDLSEGQYNNMHIYQVVTRDAETKQITCFEGQKIFFANCAYGEDSKEWTISAMHPINVDAENIVYIDL